MRVDRCRLFCDEKSGGQFGRERIARLEKRENEPVVSFPVLKGSHKCLNFLCRHKTVSNR